MSGRHAFRVRWTEPGRDNLDAILDYIDSKDGPAAAMGILDRVQATAAKLRTMPRRGRVVPELADLGIDRYRELLCGPWRIVYAVEGNDVFVHTILDGRRNVEDVLLERLIGPNRR